MKERKRRCGNYIPQEIVEDILVQLPVKSLLRYKAVSIEWRTTIESKCFLERHLGFRKSLGGQATSILALSSETRYNRLVFDTMLFSSNGIEHENSPYPPIAPFHQFEGSKISDPCDGLFCLYSGASISIINPATTCCRSLGTFTIPYEQRRHNTVLGIGREDSEIQRYKLVCYFDCDDKKVNASTKCMVFALHSTTWRCVDPPHCRVNYGHSLVHLDGVIYCFTLSTEPEHAKVLAFDLHTEKFQSFSITPDIGFRYSSNSGMRVLNHRLCIFNNDPLFQIWGLDINMRSWVMMHSIDLSNFPPQLKECIFPMATVKNYVVITDYYHNLWGLYDSSNNILHRTFSLGQMSYFGMPYFETLVSAYQ